MALSRDNSSKRWLTLPLLLLAGLLSTAAAPPSEPRTQPGRGGAVKPEPRPNPKEPWKWTLDERLALRFDPVDMRRRAVEHAAEIDMPPPSQDGCIVDGTKDPALLLPSELFRSLLQTGFHPDDNLIRKPNRKRISEKAKNLGLGADLWQVLEILAEDVIRVDQDGWEKLKRFRKTVEMPPEVGEEEQKAQCARRAHGLKAARAYYGTERFDRFLYEAVAPGMSVAMPENPEWPEQLRFVEGGCQ